MDKGIVSRIQKAKERVDALKLENRVKASRKKEKQEELFKLLKVNTMEEAEEKLAGLVEKKNRKLLKIEEELTTLEGLLNNINSESNTESIAETVQEDDEFGD